MVPTLTLNSCSHSATLAKIRRFWTYRRRTGSNPFQPLRGPFAGKPIPTRLRKTAATNWLRSGFNLMKIKNWHKSLEVTEIYPDSEMHDPEEQKKLDRAGKF
jgi:hypothetical protein